MASYHVYFTAKDGVTDHELLTQTHRFMETQISSNHAVSYRILRMTNKASFVDLPDFHLIVDYRSEADLQLSFRNMKESYCDEPHSPLMKMVSTFRVAFSKDETKEAEPCVPASTEMKCRDSLRVVEGAKPEASFRRSNLL